MATHHVCSSATTSLPPDRRGRLRNGATLGDFLAARRCGAHTRSGESCRQPAMKNGRCRMHGGLSTGPRTAEGRARCAAARRIHGFYAADMVTLRRLLPPHGRALRRAEGPPHRWAWGAPAQFAQRHRRGDPMWSPFHAKRQAATWGRPYTGHRWAWAPSAESVAPHDDHRRHLVRLHDDSRPLSRLCVSASPR
jgi:hypothetical protein